MKKGPGFLTLFFKGKFYYEKGTGFHYENVTLKKKVAVGVKLDPDATKILITIAFHCFKSCPGIVVNTFGSIQDRRK